VDITVIITYETRREKVTIGTQEIVIFHTLL